MVVALRKSIVFQFKSYAVPVYHHAFLISPRAARRRAGRLQICKKLALIVGGAVLVPPNSASHYTPRRKKA